MVQLSTLQRLQALGIGMTILGCMCPIILIGVFILFMAFPSLFATQENSRSASQRRPSTVPTQTRRSAPPGGWLDSNTLQVGAAYTTSKKTPVMPYFDPQFQSFNAGIGAIDKIRYLPSNGDFRVHEIRYKDNTPWYYVSVNDRNTEGLLKGWINADALYGQLRRKSVVPAQRKEAFSTPRRTPTTRTVPRPLPKQLEIRKTYSLPRQTALHPEFAPENPNAPAILVKIQLLRPGTEFRVWEQRMQDTTPWYRVSVKQPSQTLRGWIDGDSL